MGDDDSDEELDYCPNEGKLQWVPHCPLCGKYH